MPFDSEVRAPLTFWVFEYPRPERWVGMVEDFGVAVEKAGFVACEYDHYIATNITLINRVFQILIVLLHCAPKVLPLTEPNGVLRHGLYKKVP